MEALLAADVKAYLAAARHAAKLVSLQRLVSCPRDRRAGRAFGIQTPTMPTMPVVHIMSDRLKIPGGYFGIAPHQDWPSIQGGLDTITMWVPLLDVGSKQFPIEVIPASHLRGLWEGEIADNALEIRKGFVDSDFVSVPVARGDVVIFSGFTVHRTGAARLSRAAHRLEHAVRERRRADLRRAQLPLRVQAQRRARADSRGLPVTRAGRGAVQVAGIWPRRAHDLSSASRAHDESPASDRALPLRRRSLLQRRVGAGDGAARAPDRRARRRSAARAVPVHRLLRERQRAGRAAPRPGLRRTTSRACRRIRSRSRRRWRRSSACSARELRPPTRPRPRLGLQLLRLPRLLLRRDGRRCRSGPSINSAPGSTRRAAFLQRHGADTPHLATWDDFIATSPAPFDLVLQDFATLDVRLADARSRDRSLPPRRPRSSSTTCTCPATAARRCARSIAAASTYFSLRLFTRKRLRYAYLVAPLSRAGEHLQQLRQERLHRPRRLVHARFACRARSRRRRSAGRTSDRG